MPLIMCTLLRPLLFTFAQSVFIMMIQYFAGDLNLLAELKLANDNLRWRLERQTHALDCSAAIVQSLQEQNAKYAKQLEVCQCQESKQSLERSDEASDSG